MIVNYTAKGWQIVTQRAHGILAAEIGLQWKKKERPTRWLETLLAIAEHDDAEIELDGENLLTPQGGPLHYAMKIFDLGHCEKLERMTTTKSRYIQLLSSMHMQFLYGKKKPVQKEAVDFLRKQKRKRDQLAKALGIPHAELDKTYDFMEWCDALSLLLCENQIQPEKRMVEISTGPDQEPYEVFQLDENSLSVKPWPFEADRFQLQFELRTLPSLTFESSAAFRESFLKAPISVTAWEMHNHSPRRRPRHKVNH